MNRRYLFLQFFFLNSVVLYVCSIFKFLIFLYEIFNDSNFVFIICSQGVKIKMDDAGNILIRRYSKSSVFVKSTAATSNEETAIGQDILKLPGYSLEQEKIFKVSTKKYFFTVIVVLKGYAILFKLH